MRPFLLLALAAGCLPPDATLDPPLDTGPFSGPAYMCERWNEGRGDLSEGTWSGAVATCDAGDISPEGRASALRVLNLYRWLAGLPEVDTDPTRDAAAQECALMMLANGTLSHTPDTSWTCYTATGAEAAGCSNISTGPGVASVDWYMEDWGNTDTLGHRRWILSNGLGPVGLGSTSGASCMWVIGGSGSGGRDWTAWPPDGPVPVEVATGAAATGWSLQSDSVVFSTDSRISVTSGGQDLDVAVANLPGGYGSTWTISLTPQGWTPQAGATYHLEVDDIAWDVEVVDCGAY